MKLAALSDTTQRSDAEQAVSQSFESLFTYIDTLTSDTPLVSAAALLGKEGGIKSGAVRTEAKSQVARDNGRKGGRRKICVTCGRKMVRSRPDDHISIENWSSSHTDPSIHRNPGC